MRTLVLLALLLVGAVVIMYLVGRMLPVAHVASRGERFDASRDSVWHVIVDVASYAAWRPDLERVELLPPVGGKPAWREVGRRTRIAYVAEEVVAPERFVTRITSPGLPYGGRWRFELFPESGGTRVSITEEGEVYNPLFRFLMKYVLGETRAIERLLAALGARLARPS